MKEYLNIGFPRCPFCGVGGERAVLPIPYGAINHECSNCGNMITVEAQGFNGSWKRESSDAKGKK